MSEELEKRLATLAAKTGRTKTFYVREAIETYLEELEGHYLAEERMNGFRSGDVISLADVKEDLGLN